MKILFWTFSDNLFLDWEEEEVYCSLQSMDRKITSFNIIGVMQHYVLNKYMNEMKRLTGFLSSTT